MTLTPAEELGLRGQSLTSRVRAAFYKIPEPTLAELLRRLHDEAYRRHLIYLRDGRWEVIRVLPCPIAVLPDQQAYLHTVTLTIHNALKRLPELYLHDPAVREVLQLLPQEEAWLEEYWGAGPSDSNPVFGRLDAVIDFTSPMWKDSLRFMEPNLGGIGGLHLVPTCEHLVGDIVLPVLQAQDPALQLETGPDIRDLLMQEVMDHLRALGRPAHHICFVEPKYAGSGPDDQQALPEYYHQRFGLQFTHADPSELVLQGDEVYYEGSPVDLVYRDYPVYDLVELEREGVDVRPMRELFRQNRVISSVAAELDQKSCFEVVTDPRFTREYFTAEERQVFRRHVLWTRILADRRTLLPDGQEGDLLEYVRREQESLVLKPNRCFGGEGVQLGPSLAPGEWHAAVERALADPERWVVQQLASLPVSESPVIGPDGRVNVEPFYTVIGFAATSDGLAILGRSSQKQVVNVAQRGGMCAVMLGHPPARLHGPWSPPEVTAEGGLGL